MPTLKAYHDMHRPTTLDSLEHSISLGLVFHSARFNGIKGERFQVLSNPTGYRGELAEELLLAQWRREHKYRTTQSRIPDGDMPIYMVGWAQEVLCIVYANGTVNWSPYMQLLNVQRARAIRNGIRRFVDSLDSPAAHASFFSE